MAKNVAIFELLANSKLLAWPRHCTRVVDSESIVIGSYCYDTTGLMDSTHNT